MTIPARRSQVRTRLNTHAILWRRLDTPGHDASTIAKTFDGWRISGLAVFQIKRRPARFSYEVNCDASWITRNATIDGVVGIEPYHAKIVRSVRGRWKLNGEPQPQLDECDDLDIAFTPATNTIALNRLALSTGDTANVRAAWLNAEDKEFSVLEQTYRKISRNEYRYHSPRFDFRAKLTVDAHNIVTNYPRLWIAET